MFMIHELAKAWKMSPPSVYRKLKSSGAFDNYLVPCYDVLHTLGRDYLVDDITGYLTDRGVKI